MMKLTPILLLLASAAFAGGPNFGPAYDSDKTKQEFDNAYHDIQYPTISIGRASTMTVTYLNVSTITALSVTVSSMTGTGAFIINRSSTNSCGYLIGTAIQSVQNQVIGTSATTVTTAFVTTNSTATITPLCVTDKFRVSYTGTIHTSTVAGNDTFVSILRNGTNIFAAGGLTVGTISATASQRLPCAGVYLDNPATASAITYAVGIKAGAGTVEWGAGASSNQTAILLVEEIAQ